jgi:hypothetical protein
MGFSSTGTLACVGFKIAANLVAYAFDSQNHTGKSACATCAHIFQEERCESGFGRDLFVRQ